MKSVAPHPFSALFLPLVRRGVVFIGGGSMALSAVLGDSPNSQQQPASNTGSGDLVLSAPGIHEASKTVREVPFLHTTDLGRYYRFTFRGIEVVCDADGVPGTYGYDGSMWNVPRKNNNGHGNNIDGVDSSNPGGSKTGEDTDPTVDDEKKTTTTGGTSESTTGGGITAAKVPGWWSLQGGVNQVMAESVSFTTDKLHEASSVMRYEFTSPVIFREQLMITLKWAGEGNTKDPDGYFYILGSAVKEPPVPVGQIQLSQSVYLSGTQPTFHWSVMRN